MSLIDRYFLKQPRVRGFITRLLEGDRTHDVSLLGTTLRVHSVREHGILRTARMVQSSAVLRDELPILLHLTALFADGDTFIDIGANVGIYALTLARLRRIFPHTHFYAFEANPDTFSRLAAQAGELGVEALNFALSDHSGTLEFVPGAVSNVFTTVENISSYSLPGVRVSVPCRRLDEFQIEGNSLVLKIDVEGQEKEVLDGAVGFFRAGRVKAVYVDGYKDRAVETFLQEHGFTFRDGKTLQPTTGGVYSLLAIRQAEGQGRTSNIQHPTPNIQ